MQKTIEAMINAGLNAVRINMSHSTQEDHAETIKTAKAAAKKLDKPLAILVDLSGPKIRTGLLQNATPVFLETGAEFVLTSRDIQGSIKEVSTNFKEIPKLVKKDDKIPEKDKKQMLEEMDTALKTTPPLQYKENVALVKKFQKDIEKALQ